MDKVNPDLVGLVAGPKLIFLPQSDKLILRLIVLVLLDPAWLKMPPSSVAPLP